MQILTDFADLAVVLPLAACVAIWLSVSGWGRGAALWAAMFGMLLVLILALKLAFLGCAPAGSPVSSPSGHTASATFVFGGIAVFILRGSRSAGISTAVFLAALFGYSRVALHAHSLPEVILGGMAGLMVLGLFLRLSGPIPSGLPARRLILASLPVILVLHGARLNLEPRVRGAAHWFGLSVCPSAA